jgi:hypothetical protein
MLRTLLVLLFAWMAMVVQADARGTAPAVMAPRIVAFDALAEFSSESEAQAHCPRDVVVWLNTQTGIWHEKGMRWYGRTRHGAFVCRREAAAAGYRDTKNGQ